MENKENHQVPCVVCGNPSEPERYIEGPIRGVMEKQTMCFKCAFWEIHARDFEAGKDKRKVFIIDHNRFFDGGSSSSGIFRGFGGRQFHIQLLDSEEIITTNNLWHQGEIPEAFRKRLPDNAVFVE